jgi:hypothetical protein
MIKKHHTARVPQLKHRQFKHWILQDRCQAEKRYVQFFSALFSDFGMGIRGMADWISDMGMSINIHIFHS